MKNMAFIVALFICPVITIIYSIIGYSLTKKWFIMPIFTLFLFTILTFTIFNESFFFWTIVYTVISIIVSLVINFIKK